MSIKDLLVVLDSEDGQAPAHGFAQSLAARYRAHLTAAGVALQYVAPVSFAGDYPYELLEEVTAQARAAQQAAFDKLRASTPAGVETDFVLIEALSGVASTRLGELARHFDLTVVGQDKGGGLGDDAGHIVSVLFGSGRPVFIVPYIHKGPAKLESAMIAWDGGLAAARALAAAMPLLAGCSRIEVVTITPGGAPVEELPGFNITRHLARHGLAPVLRQLPPTTEPGNALLSHAAESGADFLVMGGYGHSRLRELVLGGATREVLSSLTLPVLMTH